METFWTQIKNASEVHGKSRLKLLCAHFMQSYTKISCCPFPNICLKENIS